jgi:uncharacterized protein YkwD
VYELLAGQDFGAGGENIAAGYESAAAVFDGWREENESYEGQGHRRNMLEQGSDPIPPIHLTVGGSL